jgi:hypothetical protein
MFQISCKLCLNLTCHHSTNTFIYINGFWLLAGKVYMQLKLVRHLIVEFFQKNFQVMCRKLSLGKNLLKLLNWQQFTSIPFSNLMTIQVGLIVIKSNKSKAKDTPEIIKIICMLANVILFIFTLVSFTLKLL